jgi:hypothetical protein
MNLQLPMKNYSSSLQYAKKEDAEQNNTDQTISKLKLIYFLEGSRSNLLHSRAHTSVNNVQSSSGEQNKKENLIQSSPTDKVNLFIHRPQELLCCGANNTPELINLLKARNNNSHTYGTRNLKEKTKKLLRLIHVIDVSG